MHPSKFSFTNDGQDLKVISKSTPRKSQVNTIDRNLTDKFSTMDICSDIQTLKDDNNSATQRIEDIIKDFRQYKIEVDIKLRENETRSKVASEKCEMIRKLVQETLTEDKKLSLEVDQLRRDFGCLKSSVDRLSEELKIVNTPDNTMKAHAEITKELNKAFTGLKQKIDGKFDSINQIVKSLKSENTSLLRQILNSRQIEACSKDDEESRDDESFDHKDDESSNETETEEDDEEEEDDEGQNVKDEIPTKNNEFQQIKNDLKPSTLANVNKSNDNSQISFYTSKPINLFGVSSPISGNNGLFGKTPEQVSTKSLFGGLPSVPKSNDNSLFTNVQQSKPTLFGSTTANQPKSQFNLSDKPLFGNTSVSPVKTTESSNISAAKPSFCAPSLSLFGQVGNTQKPSATLFNSSLFSQNTNESKPSVDSFKPIHFAPTGATESSSTCFSFIKNDSGTFQSFENCKKEPLNFNLGTDKESTWETGAKLFSKPTPTTVVENTTATENAEENVADDTAGDDEHDPHFDPIVELPPLVQVSSDDDNFDILFKNRCKLYRYVDGEWKERGVGDMKIMRQKSISTGETQKSVVLLMRREQVHKVCCNHRITSQCPSFTPMQNDKSTCWVCTDFSEGVATQEKFALKFGKESTMDEFKQIITKIQNELNQQ